MCKQRIERILSRDGKWHNGYRLVVVGGGYRNWANYQGVAEDIPVQEK